MQSVVPGSRPPSLVPILTVDFLSTLGFSVVLPSLIFLVTRFGGNAQVYGLIGATYSVFQLIGAPVLGRWSDRYGRRRILLLCVVGTFLSWCIFIVAITLPDRALTRVDSALFGAFTLTPPLVALFFARALAGATGGDVSIANAYLADVSDESNRRTNFGKMAVASNLGFVVGPAIAGLLGAIGVGDLGPVVAALLVSAAAIALVGFGLPHVQPCVLAADPEASNVRKWFGQQHRPCFEMHEARELSPAAILKLPSMLLILGVYFLVFFAFNLFYVAFPVYAATDIGWSITRVGVYFAVMGLAMALVQGPLLKLLARYVAARSLVIVGGVLLAASFPFFGARSTFLLYCGTLLLALGNGLMWPSLLAILSGAADKSVQGAVQGFAGSAGAIASIAGLIIGGAFFGALGSGVFLLPAVLVALTVVLSFRLPVTEVVQTPP